MKKQPSKRDQALRASQKICPFKQIMTGFCEEMLQQASKKLRPEVKKQVCMLNESLRNQVWQGRRITVLLKLFNQKRFLYPLELAEREIIENWLLDLFNDREHIESAVFTVENTRKKMGLTDSNGVNNLSNFLARISQKKSLPTILKQLGLDAGFVQESLNALHQDLAKVILSQPLPESQARMPVGEGKSMPITSGDGIQQHTTLSEATGGGGSATVESPPTQSASTQLAEGRSAEDLDAKLLLVIGQTLESVIQYQLYRAKINGWLSRKPSMTDRTTVFGEQNFDQKIVASTNFATYIRLPLGERNFSLLLPHLESYYKFKLNKLVARHAQAELSFFNIVHHSKNNTELVKTWLAYEQGKRKTTPLSHS